MARHASLAIHDVQFFLKIRFEVLKLFANKFPDSLFNFHGFGEKKQVILLPSNKGGFSMTAIASNIAVTRRMTA
jgi:hypothetical protein